MVKEAIDLIEGKLWKNAMEEELESLKKNDTWDRVTLPNGRRNIASKWIFKKKTNSVGHVEKFKLQLVAKGYLQVEGVDFDEIFSPIAKLTSIILPMYLATKFDLEIEQMDVMRTFILGDLEEEIYMKQPEGSPMKEIEELVFRLKKSLYGLKQTPRMWYQKFDSYI